MIRPIGKLGCAPGGNCCSECASHRLGDVPAAGDTSSGLWISLFAILGGFAIAAAASGKVRVAR